MKQLLAYLLLIGGYVTAFAQNQTISGTVTDTNGNPLIGVNIKLKDQLVGTTTNNEGYFEFEIREALPVDLVLSSVGFETKTISIPASAAFPMTFTLDESVLFGNEVVVSASRVEENILESPVSIEKMDILDIQESASQDFYGALINYKNVDMSTQSFTFRSLTLRGFNANGNTRMVQLIDGIDNQAPGLNFPVGNIVGISALDLESVELLPGASSALYGPNAINGIITMSSKSPFDYPGLSVNVKGGVNHVGGEDQDPTPFTDLSLRYAKSFNNKFAFKVNASFLDAEDWYATDMRDRSLDPAITRDNPGFEAINVLGDETSLALPLGANGENVTVTRTGFLEQDLVDYTARSMKLSGAMHYKFSPNVEGILQANFGTGQSVYTGIDRYSLLDFSLSQFKAELRGSNFTLRAYNTNENSGDSFAAGTLGGLLNEALKPSDVWFGEYSTAFGGGVPGVEGFNHNAARAYADRDLPLPGSPEFEAARQGIIDTPLSEGGAKFLDKSKLYAFDGAYNFRDQIDFAEVIIGANYRIYSLNSEGTLFALDDNGDEFNISEYGGFVQVSKRLLEDRLKLTGSLRYDKNENFDGRTTPRISGVYNLFGDHNFRVSYQTGFRMPTTQNQYIDLPTPSARLIGGLPLFRDRYNFDTNPVYDQETYFTYAGTYEAVLNEALAGGLDFETAAVEAATAAAPILDGAEVGETEFNLEQNRTIEFGYRSLINNQLMIDAYYYNSVFSNFSGAFNLFQSSTIAGDPSGLLAPAVYQTTVSIDQDVKSQGAALGLSYAFNSGYRISGNYAWNELTNRDDLPEGFQSGFNTPENKFNFSVSNRKLTDRLGFNVTWRWQDSFLWESTFAEGDVPAFATVDAQVSYAIPDWKSRLKVGGSNLFNNRYEQALGNPTVGALYYVSITFDEFFH